MYDDVCKGTATKSPKFTYTETGDNTASIVYQYSLHIDILNLIKCYDVTVDLDLVFESEGKGFSSGTYRGVCTYSNYRDDDNMIINWINIEFTLINYHLSLKGVYL